MAPTESAAAVAPTESAAVARRLSAWRPFKYNTITYGIVQYYCIQYGIGSLIKLIYCVVCEMFILSVDSGSQF